MFLATHLCVHAETDRYMAPEVFLHKTYDKSVDVFSFAIIVQEVLKS